MTLQKTVLVELAISSAILSGCVSPEEKMYREAVASYAQHVLPSDREQDVAKLEQSGSLGFGMAFVFLGDAEMTLASKSERDTSSDTGFMISARKQAIHHLNRACDYYVRAQQSVQKCDASNKIKSAEETLKTAQVDLAALEVRKINEDYIVQGSTFFDEAKREFAEAEKESKTLKKIECVTRGLELLARAVASYEKATEGFVSVAQQKISLVNSQKDKWAQKLSSLERQNRIEEAIAKGDLAVRETREIEDACPTELSGKIVCYSNALHKIAIAWDSYTQAITEGSETAKNKLRDLERNRNRLSELRLKYVREKTVHDEIIAAKECDSRVEDYNEILSKTDSEIHAKLNAVRNVEAALTEARSHYEKAYLNGEKKASDEVARLDAKLPPVRKQLRQLVKEVEIVDALNAGDLGYEKISKFDCATLGGDCRTRLRMIEEADATATLTIKHFKHATDCGATNAGDRLKLAQSKKSEIADALVKAQEEVKKLEEEERKAREEELRREEQRRIAEEAERRKRADYCIANNVPLTKEALDEIEASLNFRQSTGNSVADQLRTDEERQRFKNRQVCVEGTIRRVKGGFFGGVNVWVLSHGHTIKCGFKGMSKSEGAKFEVGSTLRCSGTIDGSESITNCSLY